MKLEITVKVVTQYGNRRVFPVCENAKLLAQVAGVATFSEQAIAAIKGLGYSVLVQQEKLEL